MYPRRIRAEASHNHDRIPSHQTFQYGLPIEGTMHPRRRPTSRPPMPRRRSSSTVGPSRVRSGRMIVPWKSKMGRGGSTTVKPVRFGLFIQRLPHNLPNSRLIRSNWSTQFLSQAMPPTLVRSLPVPAFSGLANPASRPPRTRSLDNTSPLTTANGVSSSLDSL